MSKNKKNSNRNFVARDMMLAGKRSKKFSSKRREKDARNKWYNQDLD